LVSFLVAGTFRMNMADMDVGPGVFSEILSGSQEARWFAKHALPGTMTVPFHPN
jgi:hypothetical protein